MARICLVNPKFPTSFWGLNHGLPLLGKKSNMPVLALPVIAGLTPEEHEELERLADSRGLSTSTVAREAILRLVRAEAAPRSAEDRRLVQDWQVYP